MGKKAKKIISLWINLSYAEIVKNLESKFAIISLIVVHLFLLGAIAGAGTRLGIYCCIVSGFCLFWNICLDHYSGTWGNLIRKKIVYLEKKAIERSCRRSRDVAIRFLEKYIRIHILVVCAIVCGLMMLIL